MDESESPVRLRVEAGKPIWLDAGRYQVSVVIPEHLRRPNVAAFWCDKPVPIAFRD